jgi:hypothetical protein
MIGSVELVPHRWTKPLSRKRDWPECPTKVFVACFEWNIMYLEKNTEGVEHYLNFFEMGGKNLKKIKSGKKETFLTKSNNCGGLEFQSLKSIQCR